MSRKGINRAKTTREIMAQEEMVKERVDKMGNRWRKVYFGGGAHFRNWLDQCRQLGEVQVEEIDPKGLKCYEESGERLYRVWMRVKDEG